MALVKGGVGVVGGLAGVVEHDAFEGADDVDEDREGKAAVGGDVL
jgi:hypothetical protein